MIEIKVGFDKLRQTCLCFIFLLIVLQSNSQNIVPNSSFEEFIDFDTAKITGWHKVQSSDTPDYFNLGNHTPYNIKLSEYLGGTKPKTGNGFVGIFCYRIHPDRNIKNVREYIETNLNNTLEKDSLYTIGVSLCLDAESNVAVKNFGLLFSPKALEFTKDYKLFSTKPQIEFNFSYTDSMHNWIALSSFYKAKGFEKYLIIGNFRNDKATMIKNLVPVKEKGKKKKWELARGESATYYYIDDVVLEKATIVNEEKLLVQKNEDEIKDTLNLDEIEIDSAIVLNNIIFEFNKYDLLPESYVEINKLHRLMINNPSIRIKLEGHTDNIGSYDFNLQLSLKRAEAVVRYLIEKGINPDRIEYAGYSYSFPLASNETEEGRKINRRVTFKIIQK